MTKTLTHLDTCEDTGISCVSCNDHACEDPGEWLWSNAGESLCVACYESDTEHASSVIVFSPGESEPHRWYVGDYVSFDQYADPLSESTVSRVYHRTDAWRGYYETAISGTVEISSGADIYGESTNIRELAERVREDFEEGILPVTVYVVIDLTSNVFATAMAIKVNAGDLSAFNAWKDGDYEEEEK